MSYGICLEWMKMVWLVREMSHHHICFHLVAMKTAEVG